MGVFVRGWGYLPCVIFAIDDVRGYAAVCKGGAAEGGDEGCVKGQHRGG